MTVRAARTRAALVLNTAGIEHAAREAAILLAWALRCSAREVYTHPEWAVDATALERLETALRRRGEREPLQYITGVQEFMSLEFAVGPAVLIPRPETEHLVEAVIALDPRVVVDVGTGSGAIAVAVAYYCPRATVHATDCSGPALDVARTNAVRHGVGARVHCYQCDLLVGLDRSLAGAVDVVVSNPPYIATDGLARLAPEVLHEPRLALDGGPDGLSLYRRLLQVAGPWLAPRGKLLLELGAGQARAVRALAAAAGYRPVTTVRDYADVERVLSCEKGEDMV